LFLQGAEQTLSCIQHAKTTGLRHKRLVGLQCFRSFPEMADAYLGWMTIIMERFHWIDDATYFRSDYGVTHFCRVAPMEDGR